MFRPSAKALRLVTVAYIIGLAVVSLLPSGNGRMGGWDEGVSPTWQNALHVPAYALLVVIACAAWPATQGAGYRRIALVALLCGAYGALLEFTQTWVPGRSACVSDALLNILGVSAGVFVAVAYRRQEVKGE